MSWLRLHWTSLGGCGVKGIVKQTFNCSTKIHGMSSVAWPGFTNVMTPPQIQFNVEMLSSAGALHNKTVGAPATQGAGVAGTQGIGVNTPIAAAVAAATVGLAGDMHIPNGRMFVSGM
jgi:hypothetical protein